MSLTGTHPTCNITYLKTEYFPPCDYPGWGKDCSTTMWQACGNFVIIHSVYTGLASAISTFVLGRRLVVMWGLREKNPKLWEGLGYNTFALTLDSIIGFLVAIDFKGYHGWIPFPLANFFSYCRTGLCMFCAIELLRQWVTIINAKGANAKTPPWIIMTARFGNCLFFVSAVILPWVEIYAVSPELQYLGPRNVNASLAVYAINGLVAGFIGFGSIYYGLKISMAMSGGSKLTVTAAANSTSVEIERVRKVRKILFNIVVVASLLLMLFAYSVFLFARQLPMCYRTDGIECGYSIDNLLKLLAPYACIVVTSLPGEKTVVTRVAEAVSNSKARGNTTKVSNKNSSGGGVASSNIVGAASDKSDASMKTSTISSLSVVSSRPDMEK